MTLTDELKSVDDKIKPNQAHYDLGRQAAKISALSSKGFFRKIRRPTVLEKTKFEYSPLGMTLSKSFKKCNVKNIANKESDFNYSGKHKFYIFYKQYDEFEEMSLDFNHKKMKELKRLLNNIKILIPMKQQTQLKKERIMKNVDNLYGKYYNSYKDDYDGDNELKEVKMKTTWLQTVWIVW